MEKNIPTGQVVGEVMQATDVQSVLPTEAPSGTLENTKEGKKTFEFPIKTNLVTGVLMGVISAYLIYVLPEQVREPAYNSGAPSPRIIPTIVLWGIFICAMCLIGQSVIMKKEKVFVFNLAQELPAMILIGMLCFFTYLILKVGFVAAIVVVFPPMLFYMGERKPFIYIFTLTAGIGVYYLFREVLNISLPAFTGFGG